MKKLCVLLILVFIIGNMVSYGAEKSESPFQEDGLYATIETNKGDIIMKFTFKQTPLTVCNFVGLAEGTIENSAVSLGEPYFDDMTWHRVVSNWVIQSGDPYGTGSGGPGYQFRCEIDTPALMHDRAGIVGMANTGANTKTNGSQFYITHGGIDDNPEYGRLNGGYTIFGHVEDEASLEVVMDIRKDDKINKVTITRVGEEANKFRTDQETFDNLLNGITEASNGIEWSSINNKSVVRANRGYVSCIFDRSEVVDVGIYTLNGRELFLLPSTKVAQGTFTVPYRCVPGSYIVTITRGKAISAHKLAVQMQ